MKCPEDRLVHEACEFRTARGKCAGVGIDYATCCVPGETMSTDDRTQTVQLISSPETTSKSEPQAGRMLTIARWLAERCKNADAALGGLLSKHGRPATAEQWLEAGAFEVDAGWKPISETPVTPELEALRFNRWPVGPEMVAGADHKRAQIALTLLNAWIEKQHFDPNGGPTDDADWHVVNAALILDGSIPLDHDAVRGALAAAGIRELVVVEGGRL